MPKHLHTVHIMYILPEWDSEGYSKRLRLKYDTNGKLYIHWGFIPSCHFMLQNFSWGYKTSNPISNLSHWYLPSCEGGQNPSCPDLGANGWVAGASQKYYASISPNLHLPQKWLLKWGKGTPPFLWRLGISFVLSHEKLSIGQETEHTSHSQATSTRTHATEGFRP